MSISRKRASNSLAAKLSRDDTDCRFRVLDAYSRREVCRFFRSPTITRLIRTVHCLNDRSDACRHRWHCNIDDRIHFLHSILFISPGKPTELRPMMTIGSESRTRQRLDNIGPQTEGPKSVADRPEFRTRIRREIKQRAPNKNKFSRNV